MHIHDPLLWDFGQQVAQSQGAVTIVTFHVMHRVMNALRGLEKDTMSSISERRAAQEADILHVTTPWVAQEIGTWGDGFAPRVRLASLGMDDSPAAQTSRSTPKNGPVLYVGRFSDVKGTDTFIEALKHAGTGVGDVQVVGGLPHNSKREKRWIQRLEEAAPNRLEWLGWLDTESLSRRYCEASMLVVPSRVETYGLVALEGLFHGVPVLASRCASFQDWLEPAGVAQLFDTEDAQDLARQMLRLRESSDHRARLGQKGADYALTQMPWTVRAPGILGLYSEC